MKCFVVSPIGENGSDIRKNADDVLNNLIRPVCNTFKDQYNFEVIRADEISGPTKITDDIFEHLKNDDLVIADITGHNANVFLELGYRMAIDKVFILICNNEHQESYPFDISHYRIIPYNFNHLDFEKAKEDLKSCIQITDFSKNNIEHHKGYDTVAGYDENGEFGVATFINDPENGQ